MILISTKFREKTLIKDITVGAYITGNEEIGIESGVTEPTGPIKGGKSIVIQKN